MTAFDRPLTPEPPRSAKATDVSFESHFSQVEEELASAEEFQCDVEILQAVDLSSKEKREEEEPMELTVTSPPLVPKSLGVKYFPDEAEDQAAKMVKSREEASEEVAEEIAEKRQWLENQFDGAGNSVLAEEEGEDDTEYAEEEGDTEEYADSSPSSGGGDYAASSGSSGASSAQYASYTGGSSSGYSPASRFLERVVKSITLLTTSVYPGTTERSNGSRNK